MTDYDPLPEGFDRLGTVGKAVVLGGAAVRVTANLIERALGRAADVVVDAERAFKRELDPNIEDAKILEDHRDRPAR